MLNDNYEQALFDLGASIKYADDDQQHKAFLLASLYFFFEIANKNVSDLWERQTLQSAIKYVRDFFGVKGEINNCSGRRLPVLLEREATLEDFANFVQQSLQEKSVHHKIVAREEKRIIFLYYKDYWDEFCSYCRENHIAVYLEREKFNRIILNGYLISQPKAPKPNTHRVRYDFWPVIDGVRQEPLIRVLKTILNLAR